MDKFLFQMPVLLVPALCHFLVYIIDICFKFAIIAASACSCSILFSGKIEVKLSVLNIISDILDAMLSWHEIMQN